MAMTAGRSRSGTFTDINVTPMADIMIVLLIILMVATSVVGRSGVSLPPAANTAERDPEKELVVQVHRNGAATIQNHPVARDEILARVRAYLAEGGGRTEVAIKADRDASYSAVMDVMDACRAAGAAGVALHTDRRVGS